MAKKNLKLNWNTAKRNYLEYSNLPHENPYEFNSRKYNYSLKIFNKSPFKLVIWDRSIDQKHGIVNGKWETYPSQDVLVTEGENIDELKEIAQNFINEKFKD